jgi:F-type H+-transporting ATPase subunit a
MSLGIRLFGNLFAGEILLTIITFMIPFIVPLPFLGLEIFVGFIQALVFSSLITVFYVFTTTEEAHE